MSEDKIFVWNRWSRCDDGCESFIAIKAKTKEDALSKLSEKFIASGLKDDSKSKYSDITEICFDNSDIYDIYKEYWCVQKYLKNGGNK